MNNIYDKKSLFLVYLYILKTKWTAKFSFVLLYFCYVCLTLTDPMGHYWWLLELSPKIKDIMIHYLVFLRETYLIKLLQMPNFSLYIDVKNSRKLLENIF